MRRFRFLFAAALACAALPAVPAAAQTQLKMNIPLARDSSYGVAADTFAREIDKRTNGRYRIQNFYAAALGSERESIEALQLGTLDLTMTSTGPVPNFVPEVAIFDIPFLFRDYAQARAVLDGPIGQEMLTKFEPKGIEALAWGENGFRNMTNNRHPIRTPEDLKAAIEAVKVNRARIDEDERNAVAELRAKGMQVVEHVDKAAFQAALAPTFADFGNKFGQANIDRIRNYR